jgi:hypothetical protein
MVIQDGPLGNPLGTRGELCCGLWKKYGVQGGVETAVIPDEPDVLDANYAVQGLAVDARRRVRRVRRVVWWFVAEVLVRIPIHPKSLTS